MNYPQAKAVAQETVRELSDIDNGVGVILIVVDLDRGEFNCSYSTPAREVTIKTLEAATAAIRAHVVAPA